MADVKLVVGLGNPGRDYAETRHNLGFQVVEALGSALGIEVKRRKFGARSGQGQYADSRVILLKPWTFMNRSGHAVAAAVEFYKLALRDVMVVTDDMALETGRIRVRAQGSAGGHKGLADVIEKLGCDAFARCRIGIGPAPDAEAVDYVLGRPGTQERPVLDQAIVRARDAVLCWVEFGIEKTMNEFNTVIGRS